MFNHPTSHVKCYFMGASHFRTHPSDDHQEVILRSPDHRNLSCGPSVSASKNSCLLSWPHWDWPWWPETPKPPEKLRPSKAGAANYDAEHTLMSMDFGFHRTLKSTSKWYWWVSVFGQVSSSFRAICKIFLSACRVPSHSINLHTFSRSTQGRVEYICTAKPPSMPGLHNNWPHHNLIVWWCDFECLLALAHRTFWGWPSTSFIGTLWIFWVALFNRNYCLRMDVQSPGSDMISQFGPGLNKNAIDHSNDCKANDQLMKNT